MNTQNEQQTPTTRLSEIERVYAPRPQDAWTLQRQLDEVNDAIADMTQTLLRFTDRFGWKCVKAELVEQDITRAEQQRDALLAQLHTLQAPPAIQQSA